MDRHRTEVSSITRPGIESIIPTVPPETLQKHKIQIDEHLSRIRESWMLKQGALSESREGNPSA